MICQYEEPVQMEVPGQIQVARRAGRAMYPTWAATLTAFVVYQLFQESKTEIATLKEAREAVAMALELAIAGKTG